MDRMLVGDIVQPGRVYRLESRLPVPLDLQLRESEAQPGQAYKLKRLQTDSRINKKTAKSNKKLKEHKPKKKKLPTVSWFIKKVTFARKRPPDQDDDHQPPGLSA